MELIVLFLYFSSISSSCLRNRTDVKLHKSGNKWNHLLEEHFQGQSIGYYVTYFPANLKSGIDFVNVNLESNNTTLSNLTAPTMYVINVSAVSTGGVGPANTAKA